MRRTHADGTVSARARLDFQVAGPRCLRVALPPSVLDGADPAEEFWAADADGLRAVHFARADRDFRYPTGRFDVTVTPTDGGAQVTVTAHTLLRDLLLQADLLGPEAVADEGLLTLLPGERARITSRGGGWTMSPWWSGRCAASTRHRVCGVTVGDVVWGEEVGPGC